MGKQDSKEPNQLTSEIRCNWTVKESARAIHTRANNTNNHKHAQKHTHIYIYIYTSCTFVKDAGMAGRFLLHKRPKLFARPTVVAPIWAADNTLVHEDTRVALGTSKHLCGFSTKTSQHPQYSREIFNCWSLFLFGESTVSSHCS